LMVAFVILLPEGLVSPLGRVKDWIAGRLDGRRHVATKVRSQESGE